MIRAVAGHHRDAPAVIYRIDHAGKSITFSGDIDADGLAGLRSIVRDTSLLVFNSVVLDPPGSPAILYTLHTPPKAIGEIADDGRVKQLLLSHLSPSIENARAAVEASVAARYKRPMTFARDGMRVVPRSKAGRRPAPVDEQTPASVRASRLQAMAHRPSLFAAATEQVVTGRRPMRPTARGVACTSRGARPRQSA